MTNRRKGRPPFTVTFKITSFGATPEQLQKLSDVAKKRRTSKAALLRDFIDSIAA